MFARVAEKIRTLRDLGRALLAIPDPPAVRLRVLQQRALRLAAEVRWIAARVPDVELRRDLESVADELHARASTDRSPTRKVSAS